MEGDITAGQGIAGITRMIYLLSGRANYTEVTQTITKSVHGLKHLLYLT